MPLLSVNELGVAFKTPDGLVKAVNGVSFDLEKGQTLGIVGESGSGKSQTVLALMGLLASNGQTSGEAKFHGQDLLSLTPAALNKIRGNQISMIFQDPMTSLNPYLTVERQMTEVLELHKGMSRKDAKQQAIRCLDAVRIPEATRRIDMYPHEFSGGMRQRVMIAMSLLTEPEILIADEPTTALDVTVQAQILNLLKDLQRDFGTAIIMITHDLGVVAGLCEKVMVMYGGRVMEQGPADHIFYQASHPYTVGLLGALPRLDFEGDSLNSIPGNPPNMARPPAGCPFAPRCAQVQGVCKNKAPELETDSERIDVRRACFLEASQVRLTQEAEKERAHV